MSLLSSLSNSVTQGVYAVSPQVAFQTAGSNVKVANATYNFAVNGGTIGTKNLILDQIIPVGAIVYSVILDVTTLLAGGAGASVALNIDAFAMQANTVVTNAPWNAAVPSQTAAGNFKKVVAATNTVQLVIANAALTAGAVNISVLYLLP
jgi:hypothetical protein